MESLAVGMIVWAGTMALLMWDWDRRKRKQGRDVAARLDSSTW